MSDLFPPDDEPPRSRELSDFEAFGLLNMLAVYSAAYHPRVGDVTLLPIHGLADDLYRSLPEELQRQAHLAARVCRADCVMQPVQLLNSDAPDEADASLAVVPNPGDDPLEPQPQARNEGGTDHAS